MAKGASFKVRGNGRVAFTDATVTVPLGTYMLWWVHSSDLQSYGKPNMLSYLESRAAAVCLDKMSRTESTCSTNQYFAHLHSQRLQQRYLNICCQLSWWPETASFQRRQKGQQQVAQAFFRGYGVPVRKSSIWFHVTVCSLVWYTHRCTASLSLSV